MTIRNHASKRCAVLAGLFLFPEVAWACEKCFGAGVDDPTVQGISMAMLALLVMTGVVWGGIVTFFNKTDKRAQMLASGDYVSDENGQIITRAEAANRAAHPDSEILNVLLDKINRLGYESLTAREQELLRTLSQ